MTFEEFLIFIRSRLGKLGSDSYWERIYVYLPNKTLIYVESELPYIAIRATADNFR